MRPPRLCRGTNKTKIKAHIVNNSVNQTAVSHTVGNLVDSKTISNTINNTVSSDTTANSVNKTGLHPTQTPIDKKRQSVYHYPLRNKELRHNI
ncbi:hypothetical protein Ptr902_11869 [Pyrenophora tritici-repentis]|nr:hypothetical protein Ptr902_11869 [Pyrenophora tritici-repentis]